MWTATGQSSRRAATPGVRSVPCRLRLFRIGFKMRAVILLSGKMRYLNANNILPGRGKRHLKRRSVQHISPALYGSTRRQQPKCVFQSLRSDTLRGIVHPVFRLCHPVTICEFHLWLPSCESPSDPSSPASCSPCKPSPSSARWSPSPGNPVRRYPHPV